ncbi:MAG TPA: ATP-binding protein [Acidimicrobiales bacterium]|jgi:two-component system sensor histidine kinase SenX3
MTLSRLDQAVVAGAGVLVLLVLVLLLRAWARRRALSRRLASIAARLETGPGEGVDTKGGIERMLARLERAAEARVSAEAESDSAAVRLAAALGHVPQAVLVWDDHGRVVYGNEAAQRFDAVRDREPHAEELVRNLVDGALLGRHESRTLELFGPPRETFVLTSAPLDDGQRSVGAVLVVADVSQRRRLEQVRRDFVANVGQELKAPVGALGVLVETLAAERDPVVLARLCERLRLEAGRIGRVIDDLLDLSRIESDETPVEEPAPIHLVIAQAVERVRPAAQHRGVALEIDDPPRRLTVLGDRRQLVSAVHHLVENAVKFSDPGGVVHVSVTTDGPDVEIAVRDQGPGIPARDHERIFERFYRIERPGAREGGGTGLGLAIVRHVAARHGGRVTVKSAEGEGSKFLLRFPLGPRAVTISARAG